MQSMQLSANTKQTTKRAVRTLRMAAGKIGSPCTYLILLADALSSASDTARPDLLSVRPVCQGQGLLELVAA